jgi:cation-transporting P-type ATPase 13A2
MNLQKLFGKNSIQVKVKNVILLLLDEILTPFYLFQLYSITLWYTENYYIFSTVLLITSIISIFFSLHQTRSNLVKLSKMSKNDCNVIRLNGKESNTYFLTKGEFVSSTELVPGDIIEIHENLLMPCDAIIVSGQCIVNERLGFTSSHLKYVDRRKYSNCEDPIV